MNEFNIGDTVSFSFNGKTVTGTIIDRAKSGNDSFIVSFAVKEDDTSYSMTIHGSHLTKVE